MARQPSLSPRLKLLSDLVPLGAALADVGTDHGYLPVRLLCQGRIVSAIASDLRPKPLHSAIETGRRYGVHNIQYRLCDGLSGIQPEECDTIVIAGLGGENIVAILQAAPWAADGNHILLLQPMTHAEDLRKFLSDNGYAIQRETLVQDHGILYPILEAGAGEMSLSLGQLYGGVKLVHDPLGDRYLIGKIIRYQRAVAGLHHSDCSADLEKADQLRDIITALLAQREEWRYANSSRN